LRNPDIRNDIANSKIPQWLIAEKMGIHETTLSRWLRNNNLSDEVKNQIRQAINHLLKEPQIH
jgi:DNA-binding transcriptional regulator LsrR (DeoR family)